MADTYKNFKSLSAVEKKDVDFNIFTENVKSRIAIVAPHGGGIEPGTSEIARSISNGKYNCYCFEGIKSKENKELLHISSTNFDEPDCIAVCQSSDTVVTIHGADDDDDIVFVGGLNEELKRAMIEKLKKAGFKAKEDATGHSGQDNMNLCNKGTMKKGLQFEISNGLRKKMFKGLKRKDRKSTTKTFDKFIESIQCVLEKYETR
jgi:phage replication-related protein YjqB (UPF0714/DUF867 family)